MNKQNRARGNASNITQRLNLGKTVACAPPQQVVCKPNKGSRWQVEYLTEVVIDGAVMCSKSTIQYQGFHVGIPRTTHNSNGRAHRVGNYAKPYLRVTLFRIGNCPKEV